MLNVLHKQVRLPLLSRFRTRIQAPMGRLGMVRKVVPPTPFYYGARAELFILDAQRALAEGKREEYARLMVRATHYQELAGQLPLEEGHA